MNEGVISGHSLEPNGVPNRNGRKREITEKDNPATLSKEERKGNLLFVDNITKAEMFQDKIPIVCYNGPRKVCREDKELLAVYRCFSKGIHMMIGKGQEGKESSRPRTVSHSVRESAVSQRVNNLPNVGGVNINVRSWVANLDSISADHWTAIVIINLLGELVTFRIPKRDIVIDSFDEFGTNKTSFTKIWRFIPKGVIPTSRTLLKRDMEKDPMGVSKKNRNQKIRRVTRNVTEQIFISVKMPRNKGSQGDVSVTADEGAQKAVNIRSREREAIQGIRKVRNIVGHGWDIWHNNRLN